MTTQSLIASAVSILIASWLFRFTLLEVLTAALPFMFYAPVGATTNVALSDFVFPVGVLAVALRSKRPGPSQDILRLLSGVLLAACAASFAINGIRMVGYNLDASLVAIAKVLIALGYAMLFRNLTSDALRGGSVRFLKVWAWAAFVISLLTLADVFGGTHILGSELGVRSTGTFEDPNLFGCYLAISIFFVASSANRLVMPIKILQLICICLALLSTGSRGALAAVMVGVAVTFLATRGLRARIRLTGMAATALVIVWGAVTPLRELLITVPGFERLKVAAPESTEDPRFEIWRLAWHVWAANPLFGIGPGQFAANDSFVAHNTYLGFLAENGLFGFLPLVAILTYAIVGPASLRIGIAMNVSCAVAALAVGMYSLSLENVRFTWALIGIAFGLVNAVRSASLDEESIHYEGQPRYARTAQSSGRTAQDARRSR
jgi:O-antigen ligase